MQLAVVLGSVGIKSISYCVSSVNKEPLSCHGGEFIAKDLLNTKDPKISGGMTL